MSYNVHPSAYMHASIAGIIKLYLYPPTPSMSRSVVPADGMTQATTIMCISSSMTKVHLYMVRPAPVILSRRTRGCGRNSGLTMFRKTIGKPSSVRQCFGKRHTPIVQNVFPGFRYRTKSLCGRQKNDNVLQIDFPTHRRTTMFCKSISEPSSSQGSRGQRRSVAWSTPVCIFTTFSTGA